MHFILGLLTCEVRVIDGYVPTPVIIQNLELRAIRSGNVGKVFRIVGVHTFRICVSVLVPQMIPFGCRQGNLQFLHPIRWY